MTSRERFRAAVARRQPDRVPIDLACTSLTGMSGGFQRRLREALGFTGDGPVAHNGVDERILRWAGCDFRGVGGIVPLPGALQRRVSDVESVDCWGVRRRHTGRHGGIVEYPLAGATVEDLDSFPWPEPRVDDALLERCRAEAERLAAEGRYVVVGEHPVFGILELGCWMCGYDDFLARLGGDPEFVSRFFERVFAIQMAVVEQYYGAIGEFIDVTMSGDDFGMQSGPLMSPRMFRERVAPLFAERIRRTKEIARCLFWHHTCGSVVDLLDDLIACGVEILNPVQTSAAGMEPALLKERVGDRVLFWGAVDTQDFLRTATPEEVTRGVKELVSVLGRGGGYVLAPAHNLQDDIPPENIIAMVEAARG